MRKYLTNAFLFVFLLVLFFLGGVIADQFTLQNSLIRLHVVANSDSEIDQSHKLTVRDAVLDYLNHNMTGVSTIEQAKEFLQSNSDEIENVVNEALMHIHAAYSGVVTLRQEAFNTRKYDTFTLPAGIYTALKIELGEAEGKNWWCVAFPSLCLPATAEGFRHVAIETGLDDTLVQTVTNDRQYHLRFFLLDCVGKLENFLQLY